jgi:hypothetical protein
MDVHGAYCLNFLALTERWGRGWVAIVTAWVLSVLGITLTMVAAWLLGELFSAGPVRVNVEGLSWFEFWVAIIATVLNYLRVFRRALDAELMVRRSVPMSDGSGRAAFAVAALLGPAVVVLMIAIAGQRGP